MKPQLNSKASKKNDRDQGSKSKLGGWSARSTVEETPDEMEGFVESSRSVLQRRKVKEVKFDMKPEIESIEKSAKQKNVLRLKKQNKSDESRVNKFVKNRVGSVDWNQTELTLPSLKSPRKTPVWIDIKQQMLMGSRGTNLWLESHVNSTP